jgi:glycosyltransferase involved in cell wall biosynthesis
VRVSVVIPCHDSAAFLPDVLGSVLAQTVSDFEIVLVDDGSRDNTRAVCEAHASSHPDRAIRVITQDNAGVAAARNAGIAAASAPYILPIDADDMIAPTMIERCASVLDSDAQTALVFTDREEFGAIEDVYAAHSFELRRLKYFNQISYCSMFRRSMWESIGGYRTNVSGFDDWDFWLAAAARGFIARHVPQPLLRHRRHAGSQLHAIVNDYERLFATIILNNRSAYTADEIVGAERYLATGESSALLRAAKRIFLMQYPLVREARS